MSAYPQDVWGQFAHDPRQPAYAGLRAGDEDREVVYRTLGEAYAMGRLSRDEHDERTEYASRARTLGDLPAVLMDLVVVQHPPPPMPPPMPARPIPHSGLQAQQLREGAEKLVATRLRRQWSGVAVAVLLCLMLASLTGPTSIIIPLIVTILLGGRAINHQSRRAELVQQEQGRLERQVADQLRRGPRDGYRPG